jgi:hypothetical protein
VRKAILAAAAVVVAIGVIPLIVAAPAGAIPCPQGGAAPNAAACQQLCQLTGQCGGGQPQAPASRPAQTPRPVQTPKPPPTYAPPSPVPVQTPEVKPPPPPPPPPTTVPVVTPKINPPAPGAPRNASVVSPPKRLEAPPEAVAAAKSAPATPVNPATPPTPPTHGDFNQQVQNVVNGHSGNVDVVKADNQALVRPRHWDWVDYDAYHRPTLYNPLTEAMTFRYFYNGADREVYVAAGSRVVLDVATGGVFPFTAVSDSYVASGSFYGGAWIPPDGWSGPPPPDYTPPAPPQVYQDVSAYIPAADQTVQVGQVTVVGHDDSQPAGSQDTFMLDDNTLAWGQVGASNGAQITVTKTQSLPGVSSPDNGTFLLALAAHQQPTDNTWWLWALGGGVLVITAGLIAWVVIRRRKRNADAAVSA